MLKKILIVVGVILLILVMAFFYLNNRNRTLSPPGSTELSGAGMNVAIEYSRPSVRGRMIFGEEAEGALQPYGVYWRLGANEPTTLTVSEDFVFGGKNIAKGSYTIYAIPRKMEMEVKLNSEVKFWGAFEPDTANDLVSTILMMEQNPKVEQFTISTEPMEGGVNVVFEWDTFRWELPLTKQ